MASNCDVIIKINGGFGNQLFQFFFGLAYSKKNSVNVSYDISEFTRYKLHPLLLDKIFTDATYVEVPTTIFHRILTSFLKIQIFHKKIYKTIREPSLLFDSAMFDAIRPCYIEGYFQSTSYIDSVRNIIKKSVVSKFKINIEMFPYDQDYVCVHVRRGDVVTDQVSSYIHGSCSISYYIDSIRYAKNVLSDPIFVFFTNDPEWVKTKLLPIINVKNIFEDPRDPLSDFRLMSGFRHHIISNSTYSWWAAYLSSFYHQNTLKIAPEPWYNNKYIEDDKLIPTDWIRIKK